VPMSAAEKIAGAYFSPPKSATKHDAESYIMITAKVYQMLGLKDAKDAHHVEHTLLKLAESVAQLHTTVMALDARVTRIEYSVTQIIHLQQNKKS